MIIYLFICYYEQTFQNTYVHMGINGDSTERATHRTQERQAELTRNHFEKDQYVWKEKANCLGRA